MPRVQRPCRAPGQRPCQNGKNIPIRHKHLRASPDVTCLHRIITVVFMTSLTVVLVRAASGALVASVLVANSLWARDIVSLGSHSTWKYLENGPAPALGWIQPVFDDSRWKSGPAPLGYGESHLGSEICTGSGPKPITVWFRQVFDGPDLKAGERAVLLLCADDGAVAYLNGREVGRLNVPKGPVTATTTASMEMTDDHEGLYYRVPIPAGILRPRQKNVLAIEVHQVSATDQDLYFDAALKTVTGNLPSPGLTPAARPAMTTFLTQHYLGPSTRIPDGYFDGGRFMLLGANGGVTSHREILVVDRTRDVELAKHLAFARAEATKGQPAIQRTQHLVAYVDQLTTPPGGDRLVVPTIEQITREFANQPLLLGDVLDQCQAGVCRHRALLFKVLADDAGLKAALVRGNYAKEGTNGFAHARNEVFLEDGRRVVVDVMHHHDKAVFLATTNQYVVKHYLKENNTPWYSATASPTVPGARF